MTEKWEPKTEQKIEPKKEDVRPLTIMTENDAYIAERMKDQPQSLSEIDVLPKEQESVHRLSLPDYFEAISYDCTQGVSCPHHGWNKEEVSYGLEMKMDRWVQSKRGKFVFRWMNKNKRALDHAINVRGWYLVNRSKLFEDSPKILFSVNGGVENGDSILVFMPFEKALKLRNKPSRDSLDRVYSEQKKHEGHPNFYKAKLSPEIHDGQDDVPDDVLQEGRDFKV